MWYTPDTGRIRTGTAESAIFQGLPIFLLYHGSACNRLKPIPQQGPVPHHAQNRRFRRGVAQNPRLASHFGTKDSTSQSDMQTRPIPSLWREVARSTGGWTNGRTDAKPTKHKTAPSPATREPSGALQSRTACGRQRGQEPSLTASRSRESSSHLVPACAELGPMLDALECGHEVAGADRGTLVLGGHQCGFGPDAHTSAPLQPSVRSATSVNGSSALA